MHLVVKEERQGNEERREERKDPFMFNPYAALTPTIKRYMNKRCRQKDLKKGRRERVKHLYPSLLPLLLAPKVQLASDLGPAVLVDDAGPPLEVLAHLLLAVVLAGQVLLGGGLGVGVPPGVLEHLAGGDALPGVEDEGPDEEVDPFLADGAEAHLVVVAGAEGDLLGDGVLGEGGDAGPVVVVGCADGLADEADLVELVVAGHVGGAGDELGEDGADGPDVDGAAVVLGAEEELGGAGTSG